MKGEVFTHIREFLKKVTMEYNTEFHVVFLTAMGKIVCDLAPPVSKDSLIGVTDDPTMFTVDVSAVFDGQGIFDTQLINTRNVTIYKNNTEEVFMHIDQMVLFADQILGFGLVKKEH
jgi:hypothetical protein